MAEIRIVATRLNFTDWNDEWYDDEEFSMDFSVPSSDGRVFFSMPNRPIEGECSISLEDFTALAKALGV